MKPILLVAAILGLSSACYDPDLRSGSIACSADRRCPSGFECASDGRCWKPGDADVGRLPVRVEGALTSNGGPMRSPSYRLVGGLGPSQLSGTAASSTLRTLDGVSALTKGR
jgi:hypothetical protein